MKKEVFFTIGLILIFATHGLDMLLGSITARLTSPQDLLKQEFLTSYPLTSLGIFVRAAAMAMVLGSLLAFIHKRFFAKAIVVLVLAIIFELYAIQQLSTQGRVTTLEWTLSFSVVPILMLILVSYYILSGFLWIIKGQDEVLPTQENTDSDQPKKFTIN